MKRNNNLGPRERQARKPKGTQVMLNLSDYQISFDKNAFNSFVESQGIRVTHYRAVPDPTGMRSRGDVHASETARRSSDGFIYKKVGTCHVLFSTNSANWDAQPEGAIQYSMAVMTFPEKYDDCDQPILLSPYDRLYLNDIEIRCVNMQYIEANSIGIDRLQFPATCVEHLIDADGIEYFENSDFKITPDGDIQWLTQKRPGIDPKTGRGRVYSIRYRYTPFFIVARLLHEIRISQITDPVTLSRRVERMPYQVHVVREYIFQDVNNDPNRNIVDHRYQLAPPASGAMGPKVPPAGGKMGSGF